MVNKHKGRAVEVNPAPSLLDVAQGLTALLREEGVEVQISLEGLAHPIILPIREVSVLLGGPGRLRLVARVNEAQMYTKRGLLGVAEQALDTGKVAEALAAIGQDLLLGLLRAYLTPGKEEPGGGGTATAPPRAE